LHDWARIGEAEWLPNENLIFIGFFYNEKTAIAQRGYRGQRRSEKSRHLSGGQTRFQTEIFGAAKHFRSSDCRLARTMSNLPRVSNNAMKAQQ
jgi:hypothetical protein